MAKGKCSPYIISNNNWNSQQLFFIVSFLTKFTRARK
jgi:hypothetical protein